MDIKDAHKVIENLQTRPYICSENTMKLDNGYVISRKEYFEECMENKKFLDFLCDAISPNDMEKYLSMYHSTNEKSERLE